MTDAAAYAIRNNSDNGQAAQGRPNFRGASCCEPPQSGGMVAVLVRARCDV